MSKKENITQILQKLNKDTKFQEKYSLMWVQETLNFMKDDDVQYITDHINNLDSAFKYVLINLGDVVKDNQSDVGTVVLKDKSGVQILYDEGQTRYREFEYVEQVFEETTFIKWLGQKEANFDSARAYMNFVIKRKKSHLKNRELINQTFGFVDQLSNRIQTELTTTINELNADSENAYWKEENKRLTEEKKIVNEVFSVVKKLYGLGLLPRLKVSRPIKQSLMRF